MDTTVKRSLNSGVSEPPVPAGRGRRLVDDTDRVDRVDSGHMGRGDCCTRRTLVGVVGVHNDCSSKLNPCTSSS